MSNCCMGCKDRWIDVELGKSCHCECDKYASFKSDLEARKARERIQKEITDWSFESRRNREKRKAEIRKEKWKKGIKKMPAYAFRSDSADN